MSSPAVSVPTLQSTPTRVTSRSPQVSPASRRPRDTTTIAISSERTTSSSCNPATMFRSFHSSFFSGASLSHEGQMGQIEAYLTKDLKQPTPSVPPISAPPSLTRSHGNHARSYNVSSKRGRTVGEDDINKFQAVVAEEEEEMSCRISHVEAIWTRTSKLASLMRAWHFGVCYRDHRSRAVATEDPASYFDILILAPVDECNVSRVENPAIVNPKPLPRARFSRRDFRSSSLPIMHQGLVGARLINIRRRSGRRDIKRVLLGQDRWWDHSASGRERCPTKRRIGLSLLLLTLFACSTCHSVPLRTCRAEITIETGGSILSFDLPEKSKLLDLRRVLLSPAGIYSPMPFSV